VWVKCKCQLVLAGGLAADDPEGERILARVLQDTDKEDDIHVLNLPLDDRLKNWREVNALQRAANVIMQPSTREGFGLVITEALWKGKPVIAADVGAISLQVRENDTGYFYRGPATAARRVLQLLDNPRAAQRIGRRGRLYVKEHFLLPDRIADYLMALSMAKQGVLGESPCGHCIISFHPWAKLSKRRAA
jgi:trehalose synthase